MTSPAGAAGAPEGHESLQDAYRLCETIAREHYENFPVASRFLSATARRALSAVYAFARQADDFADEGYGPGGPSREARLAALDDWERRLRACGEPRTSAQASQSLGPPPERAEAVFAALGDTIRRHRIPKSLFLDLLSAFRQDVEVSSYPSRDDLLDYCRRSANPVGRIVLAVHGVRDEVAARSSDAICTGLQLANFWQDVGIDALKSRIYLPEGDRARFGVVPEDLRRSEAPRGLRDLILEETRWTRAFFEEGRALLRDAPWPLRFHLRLVWHGGRRILEMIEEAGGDVLGRRPKLHKTDVLRLMLRSVAYGWLA